MADSQLKPFTPDAHDDLGLACEIERDAEACGAAATIERYLAAIADPASMPNALDAAIEAAIRSACLREEISPLDAAQAMARLFPAHADAMLAVALGFGLPEHGDEPLTVGSVVCGRWRVIELLGEGATAKVARATDELLSVAGDAVEVVVKRFTDDAGGDARAHALREMQALIKAPEGLVPRLVALHAVRSGAASIVTLFEPSREARMPEDLEAVVRAVRRLHRAGLVHGDLKPAHIRIRPDGSVLFLDFGASVAAAPEARTRDFARLLELAAAAHAGGSRPRWVAVARAAMARRQLSVAAAALCAASPRWRRRAAWRGAAAIALCTALALAWNGGLHLVGFELVGFHRVRPPDAFAALSATGRLIDATFDANGRLVGVRLEIPEMTELFPDTQGRKVVTGPVRIHPDGRVTISDLAGNLMSPKGR